MISTPSARGNLRVLPIALAVACCAGCTMHMPGDSWTGPLPALSTEQDTLAAELRADVDNLAGRIGERNVFHPDHLKAAEDFLAASLARAGYRVRWQTYEARGIECSNLEAELPGAAEPGEIVVIGAHYDSVRGSPGANDNASGAAAVLALARRFAERPQPRTLRFVLFVNEEPPLFWTEDMGSLVYARRTKKDGDNIVAMLSLETMGCYLDEPGSQRYPPAFGMFYPDEGNFIAFVGMSSSGPLVARCVGAFREACPFPSEGAALPSLVPRVGSSDHWSFWKQGYPALMVTDTAPYRYRYYHKPTDTPDRIDYERLARVVEGLEAVVSEIASGE